MSPTWRHDAVGATLAAFGAGAADDARNNRRAPQPPRTRKEIVMKRSWYLPAAATVLAVGWLPWAGAAPAAVDAPAKLTPTPVPAGGAVGTGNFWRISVLKIRSGRRLRSSDGADRNTYDSNKPYFFLILTLRFENLDNSRKTRVNSQALKVRGSDGEVYEVWGTGKRFNAAGASGLSCFEGCGITIEEPTHRVEFDFVFVVKSKAKKGRFTLQYQTVRIPFAAVRPPV
jgi:hypothetical protein